MQATLLARACAQQPVSAAYASACNVWKKWCDTGIRDRLRVTVPSEEIRQ